MDEWFIVYLISLCISSLLSPSGRSALSTLNGMVVEGGQCLGDVSLEVMLFHSVLPLSVSSVMYI